MPFKPGQSGNPAGRARGSRNRGTILADKLFDDRADELTDAAIGFAKQGDPVALRVCMDRTSAPLRHRAIEFALPELATAADATAAAAAITQGVARGELTPQEGAILMRMVRDFVVVLAGGELENQITRLEAQVADASSPASPSLSDLLAAGVRQIEQAAHSDRGRRAHHDAEAADEDRADAARLQTP